MNQCLEFGAITVCIVAEKSAKTKKKIYKKIMSSACAPVPPHTLDMSVSCAVTSLSSNQLG